MTDIAWALKYYPSKKDWKVKVLLDKEAADGLLI